MNKYVVYKVNGNAETRVGERNTAESALEFGKLYFGMMKRNDGILVCYEEKTADNNPPSGTKSVFHVWF